jgi:DNA-binding transcriptional regulator YdaS (Cro superfamily)
MVVSMDSALDETDPRIAQAIEIVGSQKKLAEAAGCEQQTISKLLNRQRRISAEIAVAIDKATEGRVSKHTLRPDIFEAAAPAEHQNGDQHAVS